MHHDSNKPNADTSVLRLYLDESGGEGPGTPHSVLGGILISEPELLLFETAWDRMLKKHGIPDGIHMKEFGQYGHLAHFSDCSRRELLGEACDLIRRHRVATMATVLRNDDYRECFPEIARRNFGVYVMGFSLILVANHQLAELDGRRDPIPIIMDSGNSKRGQVEKAHRFTQTHCQPIVDLHLGSLTFEDDKVRRVLQAADIIAWGTRRRASESSFPVGRSPINDLLSLGDGRHGEIRWKREWLQAFGADCARGIANGEGFMEPKVEELREHLTGMSR